MCIGFRLVECGEQAEEMARFKSLTEGGEPCVTAFEIDDNFLGGSSNLKVLSFNEYSREWAEFVFANRKRTIVYIVLILSKSFQITGQDYFSKAQITYSSYCKRNSI